MQHTDSFLYHNVTHDIERCILSQSRERDTKNFLGSLPPAFPPLHRPYSEIRKGFFKPQLKIDLKTCANFRYLDSLMSLLPVFIICSFVKLCDSDNWHSLNHPIKDLFASVYDMKHDFSRRSSTLHLEEDYFALKVSLIHGRDVLQGSTRFDVANFVEGY